MAHALALIVAVGFALSVVLFVRAMIRHGGEQERGFYWALAAAIIFVVAFGDRLWLPQTHRAVAVLPGSDASFASPWIVLVALLALYLVRAVVYWIIYDPRLEMRGWPDDLNDFVAPLMSFLGFLLVAVTVANRAYELSALETTAAAVLLALLYFVPTILTLALPWFRLALAWGRSLVVVLWVRFKDAVTWLIVRIYRFDRWQRRLGASEFEGRIAARRAASAKRIEQERQRRRDAFDHALGRVSGSRTNSTFASDANPNER